MSRLLLLQSAQVAGIGDALATYFEARTTYENHGPNFLGGKGLLTGISLVRWLAASCSLRPYNGHMCRQHCGGGRAPRVDSHSRSFPLIL